MARTGIVDFHSDARSNYPMTMIQTLVLTALLWVPALSGQDKPELKDNPLFQYWSSCKVGSWVKTKTQIDQGGQSIELEQVEKLLELNDEKAVVETTGKMKMATGEFPTPARKRDFKAKEASDKVKIDKEGDEVIEVAGKKMNCHWYEMSVMAGSKPMKIKVWMSKEIPGGSAKGEMSPDGQKTFTTIALEWEKK